MRATTAAAGTPIAVASVPTCVTPQGIAGLVLVGEEEAVAGGGRGERRNQRPEGQHAGVHLTLGEAAASGRGLDRHADVAEEHGVAATPGQKADRHVHEAARVQQVRVSHVREGGRADARIDGLPEHRVVVAHEYRRTALRLDAEDRRRRVGVQRVADVDVDVPGGRLPGREVRRDGDDGVGWRAARPPPRSRRCSSRLPRSSGRCGASGPWRSGFRRCCRLPPTPRSVRSRSQTTAPSPRRCLSRPSCRQSSPMHCWRSSAAARSDRWCRSPALPNRPRCPSRCRRWSGRRLPGS